MQVVVRYAIDVLIWGSTWVAIPFQFGVAAEELSIAYRFAIGAVALYIYALPVVAVNAHGMVWGALLSAIVTAALGREFSFSTEPGYVWSLLYLAIVGSSIAFGSYIALISKIGAARAAYTSALFPIVALAISTVVEGYQWSGLAVIGVMLTLSGNLLALRRSNRPAGQESTRIHRREQNYGRIKSTRSWRDRLGQPV